MSHVIEIINPLLAGGGQPQTGYKLEPSSEMLRETCQECERLRREFDEAAHKTFRLEERLRHAKIRHDNEQVKALVGRLAYLAHERARFNRLLIEHEAQGHPQAGRGHTQGD